MKHFILIMKKKIIYKMRDLLEREKGNLVDIMKKSLDIDNL